ncbi:MAG: ClpXP protease specificity-enhancing factor SspB [Methylocella sp.]
MVADLIRYDLLVQDAVRGVVRKVLSDVARDGVPGEHHFYIGFRTHARGVRLSARMRELYPDEMTIVLQHQFWDLSVTGEAFEVGLSFQNIPEMLLIPFDAVTRFADPSVGFELRFSAEDETAGVGDSGSSPPQTAPVRVLEPLAQAPPLPEAKPAKQPKKASEAAKAEGAAAKPQKGEPKVVSIDAFRKKS